VLVGLHGPSRRIGMMIRMDLPPAGQRAVALEAHLRALRANDEDAVIVLVITDRPPKPSGCGPIRPPYHQFVRSVRRRLNLSGWSVLDVIAVGESTWRSYLCRDPGCCPPGGRPLSEVTDSPLAVWMIAEGHVLAPDEESLLADVEPVAHAGADGAGADGTGADGTGSVGPGPTAEEALARWRELLLDGGPRPGDARQPDLRWLTAALQDRWFRDAVLLTLVPGAGTVPEEVLAGVDHTAMDGLFDAPPDGALLARGTSLLAAVARAAPTGQRADALALLAWAAWWSGEGARGRLLAARAMADQPTHTLAALVDQLLFAGVPPGWASSADATRSGTG
jgi:hypothetical protein